MYRLVVYMKKGKAKFFKAQIKGIMKNCIHNVISHRNLKSKEDAMKKLSEYNIKDVEKWEIKLC